MNENETLDRLGRIIRETLDRDNVVLTRETEATHRLYGLDDKASADFGRNCLIGAGALVTENKVIPDNSLVLGSPAKVSRTLSEVDIAGMHAIAANYAQRGAYYKTALKRIS